MFNKSKTAMVPVAAPQDKTIGTIIGEGLVIKEGTLTGTGNMRIDGTFLGTIDIDGHIVISETGFIKGDILSRSALIAGKLIGNIKTSDAIHLASTAHVEGVLEGRTVIVDEDAVFNGTCKMQTGDPAPMATTDLEPVLAQTLIQEEGLEQETV